ncbi:hypothetical protein NMG60_11015219 [Bertholletia excelsa]
MSLRIQKLRCVSVKTRAFLSPSPTSTLILNSDKGINNLLFLILSSSSSPFSYRQYSHSAVSSEKASLDGARVYEDVKSKDVALSFKQWFMSRKNPLIDHIFDILGQEAAAGVTAAEDESIATDFALAQLGLRLTEDLVLEVLNYGKDVLSCLKFFDWAGRQPGFYHTRATYSAIFKILSRAKLMSLMLDFLENFMHHRYVYRGGFYNILVMGYAVAGKPEVALQQFGRMRFQGTDLGDFAYHVLLNSLVEQNYFHAVDVVAEQIAIRGFENAVTHSILLKNFCKQQQLDKAESFLRGLSANGELSEPAISVFVGALCKTNQFEKAAKLLEEFGQSGVVSLERAYGLWIRELVLAGKIDDALDFMRSKQSLEGYVPCIFRYNTLICRLLRDNRLVEVFDLLMEMKERKLSPDEVTMNNVLCFFCKASMVDVALELYNLRTEFRHSPSSMAYNYLINTLCGAGSSDEAYYLLKNSMDQGYFPGEKTYSILADTLCRERKLDKMKELIVFALERNLMPSNVAYDVFISALCRARRVEDAYVIHEKLNRLKVTARRNTYLNLIHGFGGRNKGDIATRLLIEMQKMGYWPSRKLFKIVIRCLCKMENPEKQVLNLLEMQLSIHQPNLPVFNLFLGGVVPAGKPELAREIYDTLIRKGVAPNLRSDKLMLWSYIKGGKVSDALDFFHEVSLRREGKTKLYSTMIVGLCKVKMPKLALDFLGQMRKKNLKPNLYCYEELVKSLCSIREYNAVVNLVNDLIEVGRKISSFIGNTLLQHAMESRDLYWAWLHLRDMQNETSSSWRLDQLIGAFSNPRMDKDVEGLENLIGQCFPLNIFTYNMILKRVSMHDIDHAQQLFSKLCQKGYEPDKWTYDILVHGLLKNGRISEARRYMEEMFLKGFHPTRRTQQLI